MVAAGEGGAHCGWEPTLTGRPPVGDLASFAIGGSSRRAIDLSSLPTLLDAVSRQLSGRIPLRRRREGLFAGEVSEFELGVVVAVAHDVSVVAILRTPPSPARVCPAVSSRYARPTLTMRPVGEATRLATSTRSIR